MRAFLMALMVTLGGIGAAAAGPTQLDALVQEGLARNPEIHAAQARWDMLREKAAQAGSFDDPMLMLRAQNVPLRTPLSFDQDVMTAKVIGISQQFFFPGKRALRTEEAEQDAEAGRWQVAERRVELARMIKESYYRLFYVDQALDIVARNIVVLDDLIRSTETLYGVGRSQQQDVLKAQLERSRMEETRISLQQQRRSLEAALNSLLYRPAGTTVPEVSGVEIVPLAEPAQNLETLAEAQRPLLRSLAAQVERGKAGQALARKEYYPDFNVAFEYMQRQPTMGEPGDDMYTLGVTFNLPVQKRRRDAMVAEAMAQTRMATAELEMQRNAIRQAIADGLARLDRSRRTAALYRTTVIPQARAALDASMAAYQAGKIEFMNVLDSQLNLFNYERDYVMAVSEHQMQLAKLEGVVGAPLETAAEISAK